METREVKYLLQRYFDGESTEAEERLLENYFSNANVADEVAEYAAFFGGVSELAALADDPNIEADLMDFILENGNRNSSFSDYSPGQFPGVPGTAKTFSRQFSKSGRSLRLCITDFILCFGKIQ